MATSVLLTFCSSPSACPIFCLMASLTALIVPPANIAPGKAPTPPPAPAPATPPARVATPSIIPEAASVPISATSLRMSLEKTPVSGSRTLKELSSSLLINILPSLFALTFRFGYFFLRYFAPTLGELEKFLINALSLVDMSGCISSIILSCPPTIFSRSSVDISEIELFSFPSAALSSSSDILAKSLIFYLFSLVLYASPLSQLPSIF